MLRSCFSLALAALVLTTVGCTMCCHPYDYCGPVYQGGHGCSSCMSTAREGSILSGGATVVRSATPTVAPKPAPAKTEKLKPIPEDMPLGEVPGSERILSVTERKLGTDAVASDEPTDGVSTLPEPPKTMSSKGWTARQPSTGSLR